LEDDDKITRGTPPEGPDDWHFLWQGASKGHKSWEITGPIYQVVKSWKFWLAVVGGVVWLNRPEIIMALRVLIGGDK
jgi:hypothetical protein